MVAAAAPAPTVEPLAIDIRRPRREDLAYIRGTFHEGHKNSPDTAGMTWRHYKRFVEPALDGALQRPDTELLAAYTPIAPIIVGWIAFHRGRRVDTVHWVHARYRITLPHNERHPMDGEVLRRRRIMTQLFDVAQLRDRIAYTHKGAYAKHDHDGQTMDERLLPWLARRGQHAAFVPMEEWET